MHNSQNSLDIIIIGGGHNGLVCAYYLAKKGLKVNVYEKRSIVGGAAVTEKLHSQLVKSRNHQRHES